MTNQLPSELQGWGLACDAIDDVVVNEGTVLTTKTMKFIALVGSHEHGPNLILLSLLRRFSLAVDGRSISASGLNRNSKGVEHHFAELGAANEGSILITTDLKDRDTMTSKPAEEEEAQVDGRILVPTREEPEVARSSFNDGEGCMKTANRNFIPKSKINMEPCSHRQL